MQHPTDVYVSNDQVFLQGRPGAKPMLVTGFDATLGKYMVRNFEGGFVFYEAHELSRVCVVVPPAASLVPLASPGHAAASAPAGMPVLTTAVARAAGPDAFMLSPAPAPAQNFSTQMAGHNVDLGKSFKVGDCVFLCNQAVGKPMTVVGFDKQILKYLVRLDGTRFVFYTAAELSRGPAQAVPDQTAAEASVPAAPDKIAAAAKLFRRMTSDLKKASIPVSPMFMSRLSSFAEGNPKIPMPTSDINQAAACWAWCDTGMHLSSAFNALAGVTGGTTFKWLGKGLLDKRRYKTIHRLYGCLCDVIHEHGTVTPDVFHGRAHWTSGGPTAVGYTTKLEAFLATTTIHPTSGSSNDYDSRIGGVAVKRAVKAALDLNAGAPMPQKQEGCWMGPGYVPVVFAFAAGSLRALRMDMSASWTVEREWLSLPGQTIQVERIELVRFHVDGDPGTEKVDGEVWHCIVVPGQATQCETIANSAPALATSSGMGPLCEETAAAATLEAGGFAPASMDVDSGGDAVVRAPAGGIPMSGLAAAGGGAGVGG
jgi:hypothetical protein